MLGALKGRQTEYETARWYVKPNDRAFEYLMDQEEGTYEVVKEGVYKTIRVSVVTDAELRFSALLQNLSTTQWSLVVRTTFAYDYQPEQEVFFRNKWWVIRAVIDDKKSDVPQALRIVKAENVGEKILELVEVS